MLTIDGSMGEGGGQVLRSSLSLALLTQTAFRIVGIRAGRAKPGLMRQHLCAVEAARAVSAAEVAGAELGSTELVFRPRAVRGGPFTFSTGGAGSTTLVFQTVLLPLLLGAQTSSRLVLEGGTHNPLAPPYDFIERTYVPILRQMGARIDVSLERHGFHPAGGGRFVVAIEPSATLDELVLLERGDVLATTATALVSNLPESIARREADALARSLSWSAQDCRPRVLSDAMGPGNVLLAVVAAERTTEVFTGFGERGVRAEAVAERVADEVRRYLDAGVPVFEHLADQLLLPMALGGGGRFRTVRLSSHATTQVELLRLFTDAVIDVVDEGADTALVVVHPSRRHSPSQTAPASER